MFHTIVLAAGAVASGLVAGLLFGFAVAVMPGLGRLDDRGFLAAMQAINVAIMNPVFLIVFVAPVVLLPLAAVLSGGDPWLVAAAVLYVVGCLGVTRAGNIPLNNRLATVDLGTDDLAAERMAFERPWNRWHLVRTVATIAATACATVA